MPTFTGTAGNNSSTLKGLIQLDKFYMLEGNDLLDLTGAWGNTSFSVFGGAGNDILRGSSRTTTIMDGGTGNDDFVINNQNNLAVEVANQGYDTLRIATPYVEAGGSRSIVMAGSGVSGGYIVDVDIEAVRAEVSLGKIGPKSLGFNFYGNTGANVFAGSEGGDTMRGNAGNDTLEGKGGDDRLQGELGLDILVGDGGNDTLFAERADGDKLTGGAGADLFVFGGKGGTPVTLTDVVMDYDRALDDIVLQGIGSSIKSVSGVTAGGTTQVTVVGTTDTAIFSMVGSYSTSVLNSMLGAGDIRIDNNLFV